MFKYASVQQSKIFFKNFHKVSIIFIFHGLHVVLFGILCHILIYPFRSYFKVTSQIYLPPPQIQLSSVWILPLSESDSMANFFQLLSMHLWSITAWTWIPDSLFIKCLRFGKLLNFSDFQLPHLKTGIAIITIYIV